MDYEVKDSPMICEQLEAQRRVYRRVNGKDGNVWLYAIEENSADHVYVSGKPGSDGFGGATLTFKLEDGSELKLTGPWKTGAQRLFQETGVDLSDRFLTFGVISREIGDGAYIFRPTMIDVVYKDKKPTVGRENRIDAIAMHLANELQAKLHVWIGTSGGSRQLVAMPDKSAQT